MADLPKHVEAFLRNMPEASKVQLLAALEDAKKAIEGWKAALKCPKHPAIKTVNIAFCPACRGEAKSGRKAESSRRNGKLSGSRKGTDSAL